MLIPSAVLHHPKNPPQVDLTLLPGPPPEEHILILLVTFEVMAFVPWLDEVSRVNLSRNDRKEVGESSKTQFKDSTSGWCCLPEVIWMLKALVVQALQHKSSSLQGKLEVPKLKDQR